MAQSGFVTYTGETNERGEPHGKGFAEYGNGDSYDGEFKDGKMHGQGVGEFADGSRYEGQFKDDGAHGQGVAEFASGERYEGQWKDSKFHGRLFTTRPDGSSFTTLWENGEIVSSEDVQSMSTDELTLELLKLTERVNDLSKSDQQRTNTTR